MKIITKSVKCGDCSIVQIQGNSCSLLVDCGSDNRGNGLNSGRFAFSNIETHIVSREIKHILISHFHKDHFNGILEIPDEYHVQTTYLPYCFIDGEVIFIDGITRLLAFAPPRSWGFQLSNKIIELFRKLSRISDRIQFLKRGNSISIEDTQIRILWPEITSSEFRYDNLPVKLAFEAILPSASDEIAITQNVTFATENNLSTIEKQLETNFNELIDQSNETLQSSMSEFNGKFNVYLQNLHDGEKVPFEVVEVAYSSLLQQHEQFVRELSPEKLERVKFLARQQYHSLVTSMNAISIVCDCDEKFLFLGDAPARVVEYLDNNSLFNEHYRFVKIQHHGTQSHFSPSTPNGEYNVISNGGHFYRRVSEEYQSFNNILCTNAHNQPDVYCKWSNKCSPNCVQIVGEYTTQI